MILVLPAPKTPRAVFNSGCRLYFKARLKESYEIIAKLAILTRVEEGDVFKPEEYFRYFEDLKIEPDKKLGQKGSLVITS